MSDEEAILECQREIRRLRNVVRCYGETHIKLRELCKSGVKQTDKEKVLYEIILLLDQEI